MVRLGVPALVLAVTLIAGAAVAAPDLESFAAAWADWVHDTTEVAFDTAGSVDSETAAVGEAAAQWTDILASGAGASAVRLAEEASQNGEGCFGAQAGQVDTFARDFASQEAHGADAAQTCVAVRAEAAESTQGAPDAAQAAVEAAMLAAGAAPDAALELVPEAPEVPDAPPSIEAPAPGEPPSVPSIEPPSVPSAPEPPTFPALPVTQVVSAWQAAAESIAIVAQEEAASRLASVEAPAVPEAPEAPAAPDVPAAPALPDGFTQAIGPAELHLAWTLPAL
jgi:hypothetical protein